MACTPIPFVPARRPPLPKHRYQNLSETAGGNGGELGRLWVSHGGVGDGTFRI